MRVIRTVLKLIIGTVLVTMSLAWLAFFGIFGTAFIASVIFAPVGIACYGLAMMPLFSALAWTGLRRSATVVVVNA